MDGTQKLPQRMLDSIRWHLAHDSAFPCLALGVAGWMRYVGAIDDAGQPIDVRDPMAETLKQCVANSADGAERVQALLGVSAVFGDALPQEPRFVEAVTAAYLSLMQQGAAQSCAELAAQA